MATRSPTSSGGSVRSRPTTSLLSQTGPTISYCRRRSRRAVDRLDAVKARCRAPGAAARSCPASMIANSPSTPSRGFTIDHPRDAARPPARRSSGPARRRSAGRSRRTSSTSARDVLRSAGTARAVVGDAEAAADVDVLERDTRRRELPREARRAAPPRVAQRFERCVICEPTCMCIGDQLQRGRPADRSASSARASSSRHAELVDLSGRSKCGDGSSRRCPG